MKLTFKYLIQFYRSKQILLTDERINMSTEVMNAIKIIKMYCWEGPFEAIINKIRRLFLCHFINYFGVWIAFNLFLQLNHSKVRKSICSPRSTRLCPYTRSLRTNCAVWWPIWVFSCWFVFRTSACSPHLLCSQSVSTQSCALTWDIS